ncbi:MAG: group I intron-associated PD-(D/E)XK endonuclease [Patescibacteria group bacterium]
MSWARNITGIDSGIFRSINGNSDEMIGVGRCMKAGFPCSRVDVTNAKYDAIVDIGNGKLLRVQIKGTAGKSVDFTGGGRSGKQISRTVSQRTYKYTKADIDIILAVNSSNGDCYIIPVEDIDQWGNNKALSKLGIYKENWDILKKIALS